MKKIFSLIILSLFIIISFIDNIYAYVSVKGYTRKDGTYVAPYVRSNPNGVKFDNYGYKPSQGLYNDTYGTRGTEWDTPTYTTDTDYYEGLNIYNNNINSNSKTTNNGYYSYGTLSCNSGYTESYNKTYCIKIPENAHSERTTKGDVWICDYGYKEIGSQCIKDKTKDELCSEKYHGTIYRSYDDKCICPGNNPNSWDSNLNNCPNNNIKLNNNNNNNSVIDFNYGDKLCNNNYGINSVNTNGEKNSKGEYLCYCKNGYVWNSLKTSCIKINIEIKKEEDLLNSVDNKKSKVCGINSSLSSYGTDCYCDSGYRKYNGICTADK